MQQGQHKSFLGPQTSRETKSLVRFGQILGAVNAQLLIQRRGRQYQEIKENMETKF
jgi:hypothetical protein